MIDERRDQRLVLDRQRSDRARLAAPSGARSTERRNAASADRNMPSTLDVITPLLSICLRRLPTCVAGDTPS
jgi:hypothetical protein